MPPKQKILMQFEFDDAVFTSHSHRGFSPVSKLISFLLEPFQRFGAQFKEARKDKPLKRFKAREVFLAAGLKPRRE
jgi:hypothetical protein